MEFLTKQEQKTFKTAKTKNILNVIIYVIKNNKHINTIVLTNEQAKTKLINVLLDQSMHRNKTQIKVSNICHCIKAQQQIETYLQDDTQVKYKYIYTFRNIPNTILLY